MTSGPARRRTPLTGAGWTVLCAAAALYTLGAALGYRLLAAVAVGLLVLLAAAVLWVLVQPRVDISRTIEPDRVTVGNAVLGRIDVHNPSVWPSVPFVAVDRIGTETVTLPVGALPPGGRRPLYYPIPTAHRGRVVLGPLTAERRDPLGLFRRARPVAAPAVLWVHPRVHHASPLPVGIVLDYEALTTANSRLGTLTFSSLRDYAPGDDPRRIHWPTTARAGHLIVKEHIDTTEPTTSVVLDNVAVADPGLFEHAVEIAASIFRSAERAGHPVRLATVHDEPVPGARTPLDTLAGVASHPDSADRLLGRLQRLPAGGVLVVITGVNAALLPRLAEERRRFTPVVVVQLAAAGDDAPDHMHRRAAMAIITSRTAADAIGHWNHLAGGRPE